MFSSSLLMLCLVSIANAVVIPENGIIPGVHGGPKEKHNIDIERSIYTTLKDPEAPELTRDGGVTETRGIYSIHQEIAERNDKYEKMTWIAAFANGIYDGKDHNKDKVYSLINGYKLIKQWGQYKMGLFQKVTKPNCVDENKYVLAVRGTDGIKDLCTDAKAFFSFPDRLPLLFEKYVQTARDLPSGSTLEVTGHSLGGWLSAVMTCMLLMDEHTTVDKNVAEQTAANTVGLKDGQGGVQEVPIRLALRAIRERVKTGDLKIVCHSFNPAVWSTGNLWPSIAGKAFGCLPDNYRLFHFYRIANDPITKTTHSRSKSLRKLLRAGMKLASNDKRFVKATIKTGPQYSVGKMCTLTEFPDNKYNLNPIWNHLMTNFLGSENMEGVNGHHGMDLTYKYYDHARGYAMADKKKLRERLAHEFKRQADEWATNRTESTFALPSFVDISGKAFNDVTKKREVAKLGLGDISQFLTANGLGKEDNVTFPTFKVSTSNEDVTSDESDCQDEKSNPDDGFLRRSEGGLSPQDIEAINSVQEEKTNEPQYALNMEDPEHQPSQEEDKLDANVKDIRQQVELHKKIVDLDRREQALSAKERELCKKEAELTRKEAELNEKETYLTAYEIAISYRESLLKGKKQKKKRRKDAKLENGSSSKQKSRLVSL